MVKSIQSFPKKERKIFAFLTLTGNQHIIGTTPIEYIKYKTDFDLYEYKDYQGEKPMVYEIVLEMFQKKFLNAYQNPNIWITDMKCGVQPGGIPIRWNRQTIAKGFQYIEDKKVSFVDCLQQTSTIKLDVLATIDGILNEFSEVYFLTFGNVKTYNPELSTKKQLATNMKLDALDYKEQDKLYKSLKRLFAFFRLYENKYKVRIKKLVTLFNSPTGKLATLKGDLEEIKLLIENGSKFRPVPKEVVKKNLKYIHDKIDDEFKPYIAQLLKSTSFKQLLVKISSVMEQLNDKINENTQEFLQKNKNLYNI